MERRFYNREFEEFVKKNADQYRMIPSEKVWKGINNNLHSRRKRYVIGIASLLLVTSVAVTWVMLSYPDTRKLASQQVVVTPAETPVVAKTATQSPNSYSPTITSLTQYVKSDAAGTTEASPKSGVESSPLVLESPADATLEVSAESSPTARTARTNPAAENPRPVSTEVTAVVPSQFDNSATLNEIAPLNEAKKQSTRAAIYMPLTIESVVNSYTFTRLKKKLTWQFYFTPTVSYRKLNENKSFQSGSSSPLATTNYSYPFFPLRDVNSSVTHKPDMGIEVGMVAKYPLTKSLRLTGGLQFNINRYDIKAFTYYGERATINLSGDNSLRPWTYYRNYDYDGSKSDWLKNLYFSVSAPIGAELKVLGNKNTWVGMAGTVQPTYIIGDRAYLLSTDLKNYAEAPSLIRHVNVNTSFETFISYQGRSTRWQIGPQVRYQVLSSFKNKYPVRENLFDYGIKVGITLNR